MFRTENEPLVLLIELTPRLAKRRFRQCICEAWDHKCAYAGLTPPVWITLFRNLNLVVLLGLTLPYCLRCNGNIRIRRS